MKNHIRPVCSFLHCSFSRAFTSSFKNLPLLIAIFITVSAAAQTPDSWIQKSSFPGTARATAFAFSIGNKGYVGGGLNFSVGTFDDFWQYNPSADSWTQKANLGGGARSGVVGFAIGAKGYALTGNDFNAEKQKDIWEYDTLSNSWTQKTDLPGIARNYSVAFSIGSKGYIGTGYTSSSFISLNDFWQFDPVQNTWTQKANVPGPQRSSAIGFSIGGKGYLGTGDTCNDFSCFALNDFYCYDTLSNSWTQKANAGNSLRNDATAFVINGKGYICTGEVNFVNTNDLLEYDPIADMWMDRAPIPGLGKTNAIGFGIGDHGYVGTGYDPFFNTTQDFYEYTPDTSSVATSVGVISKPVHVLISPDPVTTEATFTIVSSNPDNVTVEIFSSQGNKISSAHLSREAAGNHQSVFHFRKDNLPEGVYFYSIKNNNQLIESGKFMLM